MLGRLEVSVDNRPVVLGKNRQLVILSLLIADAGRTVSVGRIVEAIWNGHPPRTAAEQVQTCIWRLRKALTEAGAPGELIETTPNGYALAVRDEDVDIHRFERQVTEARQLALQGDLSLAASQMRCALALFRGPVLAEVPSPVVRAVAAKWEERRLVVLEECVRLELECGHHRELIDELAVLVEDHPLREQLRAQLMYALYLNGRRAEALESYRAGRAMLVDQLGLEPGRELQEVHRVILADEHSEDTLPQQRASVQEPVPAQLVADLPDYVERHDYEMVIRRALTSGHDTVRICGLHGHFGLGKTALAVHIAHQLRDQFPDGQLFADLRGSDRDPTSTAEVLSGFLRALGVPDHRIPVDISERAAQYRSLLNGRRILVVLDDVRTADSVRPLLPGGPEPAVLMTSRSMLSELPGNHAVKVGAMTVGQASELITNVIGAPRVAEAPEAIRRIAAACGGLPLAVRASAARLAARRHLDLHTLTQRLTDEDRLLDELCHGALNVRAYLEPSVGALDRRARRIWFTLGLLEVPDFGAWAASAAADVPIPLVEEVLELLLDRGLVDVAGADRMGVVRYRIHRLAGLYARERGHQELPEGERHALLDRAADCWLGLGQRAQQLLSQDLRGSALLECPSGACQTMIDMVESDPRAWLQLEAEGLRFAAARRGHTAGLRMSERGGPDRWDFANDISLIVA
ncbi:AfsR/SARP family transcriptional regulator [Streptomyces otsuchiensis]|uniref:AfsR/SARP family transcriptional regulator n=1 Tax=Streptomyces otsuchiensis TaxID=2681388 RepID=UPI00147739C6|nr:AfsR/SARP family transcriptional regulator [Streptomyces otsuchiensis]